VNLTGGSTVKIDPIAYVGFQNGSRGIVNVGDGSKLELSDSLFVGYGGSGTLNITDGGTVEASSCYVGDSSLVGATGQGFVTVNDSTLKCTAGLFPKPAYIIVIVNGSTLDITHKGKVESDSAAIGDATVTVSNDHSSWKCNGAFKLSDGGKVFVTDGGEISSQDGSIGIEDVIKLKVSGFGVSGASQVSVSSDATITTETFEITGDSQVSVTSGGTIAAKSVEIKGGSLVSVTSGGTITAKSGSVSNDATVTVDGTDSLWDITDTSITGTLSIDNATLTLSNGGCVKVGDPSDTFSILNLGVGLYVSSQGTLNIGNGGGAGTLSVGYVFPAMLGTGAINFNHNEASHTFAPSIQGAIAVHQIGSGVTVLSAENTFTGGTHIEAGGLRLANQNAAYNSMVQLSGGNLLFDSSVSGHAFTLGGLAANSAGPGCDISLLDSAGSPVALSIGYNNDASTYAGVLSGSGSLTKFGDGTLTLAGANTYGGLTTVRSGTLTLANARTLQNSTLRISGGSVVFDNAVGGHAFILGGLETDVGYHITLQDNAGNPVALSIGNNNAGTAYAGILSGAGSLTKIGSGTLTLADANTYTGDTTVSAGKLILKNPLAVQASTLRLAGGALVFDSSVSGHAFTLGGLASSYAGTGYTIALQDNALTPAAVALSIGNNDVNSLYAGALTGSGSLIKEGSGTLTLTGQSSYQGATLITQGAVIVEGGGSISKTSRVTVDSGDSATTAALTVDGLLPSSIVVLGNMTVGDAGVGTLTLRNWGTVNVGGRNGTGVLTLADHAGSVGTLNIDSGDGAGTLNAAQVTGGAGTASVNFNQTDDSYIFLPLLTGSLALNQNGSGTTVLVRSNTHTGATQVNAGTLQVANGNALQNSTLTMGGGSLILDSAVSGNAFTLGGLAAISSGPGYDLALENNAATPNAVALSVGNNNSNTAYAGNLSGPGSLTKIGTGILALNSYNNYEGFTTVAAGTLLVNGSNTGTGAFNVAAGAILGGAGSLAVAVNVTGVLAPGASINVLTPGASIGTLTSGALNLADHSTYQYEVNSSVSPTVGADLYIVNGALNLGTSVTLNLSDLGTGMFATGTVFSLFNYATGSWNNALFTYNSAALADDTTFNFLNRPWSIDYNATTKGVNVAGTGSGNYVNITATDAYTLWIQTPAFAIPADQQDPNDDPDGDGASNLDEFAFGGIPNDPTHKGLIFGIQAASSGAGGAKQMILTIAVRNGVTFSSPVSPAAAAVSDAMVDGLNYTILGSSNLTDWTTPVIPAPVINPGLPTLPPGYQYVSFVLSGSDGLPTRGFLRAMVERP
jgi:T5SS/PEP-CTERM-associated repeat protein/autotransporter-associated beta strand protein